MKNCKNKELGIVLIEPKTVFSKTQKHQKSGSYLVKPLSSANRLDKLVHDGIYDKAANTASLLIWVTYVWCLYECRLP